MLLAITKAVIGTATLYRHMDAVNNLSDTLSYIITIVGTKLPAWAPDKRSSAGTPRNYEDLTAMVIWLAIVLYTRRRYCAAEVRRFSIWEHLPYECSLLIIAAAVLDCSADM